MDNNDVPEFVNLVRSIVPADGVKTDKPSRFKSKVKKLLAKNNIANETLRGMGQKVGDFAITYDFTDGLLTAKFQAYDSLVIQPKKKSKGSRAGKTENILTGRHTTLTDVTLIEFAKGIIANLPKSWEQKDALGIRWLSTDASFLLNTQHTVETATDHIIALASDNLSKVQTINYAIIAVNDTILIAVGPA